MRAKSRRRFHPLPLLVTTLAVACGQVDEVEVEVDTIPDTRQPAQATPERVLEGGVVKAGDVIEVLLPGAIDHDDAAA